MGGLSKNTTRVLAGLAVVFIIVLTIICLVPPSGSPHPHQAGKSSGTVPEDILTETPETSTETSTSTTTTVSQSTSTAVPSTSTVSESSTSESTTEVSESSTTTSTLPVEDEEETTTSDYEYPDANDTEVEEHTQDLQTPDSTTDFWFSSTTTSTSEVSSSTTEDTIVESSTSFTDNHTSTSDDDLWSNYNDTEEILSTTVTSETSESSPVTSTTHHFDEVHNETSTEIYYLFNETTAVDYVTTHQPTTTTEVEEETLKTTTQMEEETLKTTTEMEEETLKTTTEMEEETLKTTTEMEEETLKTTTEMEEETTRQTPKDSTTTAETETTMAMTTTTEQHQSLPLVDEPSDTAAVCTHPDCKELAARMLDMIDHRADPCQDFYQYACGGVEDDEFLHPEDPSQQVYHRLLEMLRAPDTADETSFEPARQFYKNCTDHPRSPSPQVLHPTSPQVLHPPPPPTRYCTLLPLPPGTAPPSPPPRYCTPTSHQVMAHIVRCQLILLMELKRIVDCAVNRIEEDVGKMTSRTKKTTELHRRVLLVCGQMVSKLREQVNKYGLLDPRVLGSDSDLAKQYAFIDEDTFNLQNMIADFIKLDYPLFFDVGVDIDKRDNKNFVVRLSLPLDGFDSGLSESIDTTFCAEQHQKTMEASIKAKKPLDLNIEYEKFQQCRTKGLGQAHLVNRLQEAARALNLTQHVTSDEHAQRLLGETALDSELLLQDIKVSRRQDIKVSKRQDIKVSRRQDIKVSRRQDIKVSRRQDIKVSRRQDIKVSRRQDIKVSRKKIATVMNKTAPALVFAAVVAKGN
ncbi:Peptidase M13 N-terminal domain [Trinorchestia longiramus]|nr:Peptidase M13 N-terminal domain [Trinorchestia longiramus]